MVSIRELHALLLLLTFMGATFALHWLVSAERFKTNFSDANLTTARTKRTPRADRAPGIEPRTDAPDLTQRTLQMVLGTSDTTDLKEALESVASETRVFSAVTAYRGSGSSTNGTPTAVNLV